MSLLVSLIAAPP